MSIQNPHFLRKRQLLPVVGSNSIRIDSNTLKETQKDLEKVADTLNDLKKRSGPATSGDESDSDLAITDVEEFGNGGGKLATVSRAGDPDAPEILLVDEHLKDPFAIGHSEAKKRVEQADEAVYASQVEMKSLANGEDWQDRFI